MGAAIEAHGLTKRYGDVQALDGVDLVVPHGTVFGLLGPNGAGKTTAVRVLTTTVRPDAGTATVLGVDVRRHPQRVRSMIGLAGQYAAVDERLTGRENLVLIGQLTHQPRSQLKARADEEAFNAAMNKAQGEMGRVSVDAANQQTRSTYATYGQLDKAVRPIYTRHGFSISFNEGDGAPEGHARILAYVSHSAGHTRTYKADIPNDGKGAKGGDVMTKTHATGSAHSYGRRYLLKDIFNIAIGEEDNDGNGNADEPKGPDAQAFEAMLDGFREAALNGEKALRKYYADNTPTDDFWKRHSRELKEAARRADAEAAQ